MRAVRTFAIALLAVALVAGPTLAPAIAIAPASSASAAEPLPYIPSDSKWRQWMINVLSSVLGAATPNKWKAEQIANAYKYDGGFETLNRQFGIDGIRYNEAGQIVGVKYSNIGTGTYTDVAISGLEQSYAQKSATGKGPVRAPATPIKSMFKVVGGVASVLFAYEFGAAIGGAGSNAVGSFIGYDPNGLVCAAEGYDSEFQRFIFRAMAGQSNCDNYDAFHADYLANLDASGDLTLTLGGDSLVYARATVHSLAYSGAPGPVPYGLCYSGVSPVSGYWPAFGSPWQLEYLDPRGTGTWIAARTSTANQGTIYGCSSGQVGITGEWSTNILRLRNTTTAAIVEQVAPVSDLERENRCDVEYTDGTTASGLPTASYRETEGSGPLPACPDTPAGKTPESVQVVQDNPGSTPDQVLQDEQVTPEYQDWWEEYPECRGGACKLDLIRKLPLPAASCFDLDAGCPDWFEDPEKTDKYQCRYGTHNVALDECNVYAGIFQPGRVATGSPYADPTTGTWSGGQNSPRDADSAMTRTIQDPESLRSCRFPNAFADPGGAFVAAGQCLMEWTFVPRPVVVETHFAGANEAWQDKPPALIAETVSTLSMSPSASGCSISVNILGVTGNVLDVCSGPMALLPVFTRLAISGVVVIIVFNLIRRQIAAMAGYNQGQG